MYEAAVTGAAPGPLTAAAVRELQIAPDQRVWLYAIGKAAHPMAAGAVEALRSSPATIAGGLVVAPEPGGSLSPVVTQMVGDHPLPSRGSFAAARRLSELTSGRRAEDVVIVLLSGGASSLVAAPMPGMADSDFLELFERLMGAGLDIHAMNAVRKRFSLWGAGRLALALAPARTFVLVMSDVPGDDPADVGSGPCSPDPWTAHDVLEILRHAGLLPHIPPLMLDHLTDVSRGSIAETPKAGHAAFANVRTRVIGANRLALDAAAARARALSLRAEISSTPLHGEAQHCGRSIAESLLHRAERGETGCVLWGGETVVRLRAPLSSGQQTVEALPATGGRCQELALAAARIFASGGGRARGITLLAAGTDGRDGPTDAAGAFADATTWRAIERGGHDPDLALARHESYAALHAAGALLFRGLTGTNVMDVVIGVVE